MRTGHLPARVDNTARDEEIKRRVLGESLDDVAKAFKLTSMRIRQIVYGRSDRRRYRLGKDLKKPLSADHGNGYMPSRFIPVIMGCICPPTSERTCQNPMCPRRNPL